MGKRKLAQLSDSEEEGDEKAGPVKDGGGGGGGGSDDESAGEPKPLGEVIKRLGRSKLEKRYYQAFELDGNRYELDCSSSACERNWSAYSLIHTKIRNRLSTKQLEKLVYCRANMKLVRSFHALGTPKQEDPVLVTPEERNQKPYVAIIKEIKQSKDGSIAVTGQWFYRPEEAEKKGGGSWVASDSRELFYSFHRDEVAAESVMHKCVVHFIPSHKQPPLRSKHPGFIVRKVYDTVEKKLWRLTDKDYEDSKQSELDLLVQKTRNALGDLPDVEPEEAAADQEEIDKDKGRRQVRRRTVLPINVNKEEHLPGEIPPREGLGRPDTPGSCLPMDTQSEGYIALHECNAFTGNKARDRWLEKLAQGVKYVCKSNKNTDNAGKTSEGMEAEEKGSNTTGSKAHQIAEDTTDTRSTGIESTRPKKMQVDADLLWPEAAVAAVIALERTAYETLSSDMHKYNLKMRQLDFNLRNSTVLAQRLLKTELDASKVLNMSPAELKDGLTAEEKSAQEPEEPETMQMADVRCTICGEKKVGVKDIIHVGYGDRYQLECLKCGNSWYSSRDSISSLTIQTLSSKLTVGTAPWATSKFEEVERELTSPRESEKSSAHEAGVQGNTMENRTAPEHNEVSGSHSEAAMSVEESPEHSRSEDLGTGAK